MDFRGKVAIVTGSTRGIGLATARMLAAGGAHVAISSRKADACQGVADKLNEEGLSALAIPAHAARDEDLARLVGATIDRFGSLDIVVGNVAINPVFDPLADVAEDSWAKVLDTNVSGPLRLARHAYAYLSRPGGAFVLVSSVNAHFGFVGSGAYGISKAAVEQMVRQLAVEWGPEGLRVNAVCPGTTDTDMIRELADRPGFAELTARSTPLGRIAQPEDIAGSICFLASAKSRHVTGQVLVVDGGQSIMRGQYGPDVKRIQDTSPNPKE